MLDVALSLGAPPDIASSNDGEVFAVWTDDTNGKKQVLFTSVT